MNERMTRREADGQAVMDCQKCEADWTGKHGNPMDDCTALYCRNRLKDRLAEYEDTEREPKEVAALSRLFDYTVKESRTLKEQLAMMERIRELMKADKTGRLVVLPCNVGDRLYEVTGRKTISVYEVKAIRVELFGLFIEWNIVEGFVWQSLAGINAGEIGKIVFLTREEAEKAIEEAVE